MKRKKPSWHGCHKWYVPKKSNFVDDFALALLFIPFIVSLLMFDLLHHCGEPE